MIIAHGVDRVLRKERRQIPGFIQVKGIAARHRENRPVIGVHRYDTDILSALRGTVGTAAVDLVELDDLILDHFLYVGIQRRDDRIAVDRVYDSL